MLIFKITFSCSGDNLYPNNLISEIKGGYIPDSYHSPNDVREFGSSNEVYGYGTIFFMHPKIFGIQGDGLSYEEWFISLIEDNYNLFIEHGAEDFQLFIEVYYSDNQCNFEIFNKEMLKRIHTYGVSIPVSVYHLNEMEISKLLA